MFVKDKAVRDGIAEVLETDSGGIWPTDGVCEGNDGASIGLAKTPVVFLRKVGIASDSETSIEV